MLFQRGGYHGVTVCIGSAISYIVFFQDCFLLVLRSLQYP
jgi:hypothetical protein